MYEYDARIVRIIDGDSVELELTKCFNVEIDFGFRIHEVQQILKSFRMCFRLSKINTPEIVGAHADERAKGLAAKVELERLITLGPLTVETFQPNKHGHWLVEIFVHPPGGEKFSVNDKLLEGGFAEPLLPA